MVEVCNMASDDNFRVDYRSISIYGGWSKQKPKRRVSMYYLSAYCAALGLRLAEMLSVDFEAQESGLK